MFFLIISKIKSRWGINKALTAPDIMKISKSSER